MPEVETSTVTTEALDPLQLPRLAVSLVQLSASVVLVCISFHSTKNIPRENYEKNE